MGGCFVDFSPNNTNRPSSHSGHVGERIKGSDYLEPQADMFENKFKGSKDKFSYSRDSIIIYFFYYVW